MPQPTLNDLRATREKANADLQALYAESTAEGFVSSAEWEAKWTAAQDAFSAAKAAEDTELARLDREAVAARARADSARANDSQRQQFRPDYTPGATDTNPNRPAARVRAHGPLRAFKGPDAAARAERAGMWALATLYGNANAARWCAANGVEIRRGTLDDKDGGPGAVLNTNDNARGGIFVPNEVDYTVQELALQYGVFRQFADVVPMGSGTKESPRWTGGMTAYWIGEGQKPAQSDPAWDLIQLVAKKLGAMSKMTREVDEDSAIDLGDKVAMAIAEAFAYAEDAAGFLGDGTSTYGGIMGLIPKILAASSAARVQAAAGHDTVAELTLDDFNAVVAAYPNYPTAQPRWFAHKAFWANAMQRLQLSAGGVLPSDYANGGVPMFLGYPVTIVNVMSGAPAASGIGAIFGDLRLSSKLGNRRGRTVEWGYENDDFTKGLMTVLSTERVAINNHTITDPRNAANAGPVIGLQMAA